MALWPFGTKEEASLSNEQKAALRAVVANAKYELLPLKNVRDQAAAVPPKSQVTVTASPQHTLEVTLDVCEHIVGLGHDVTPHFSARMTRDKAHLTDLLARAKAIGLKKVFVVGGDAKDPGEFKDGLSLLRAMHDIGHPFEHVGVPSYPDGHAEIPDDVLMQALKDKQQYADSTTTQMCFDPEKVDAWVALIRREGITLPINLGIPGALEITKLMTIAARIGVGQSTKFLSKNLGLVGALVNPGAYGADTFLKSLVDTMADPSMKIAGIHIFTMNQVPSTAAWHQKLAAELRG
jgi:methylenetetrahydrofolate reductase (NADPH)